MFEVTDPEAPPRGGMSDVELEECLCFCMMVAGHNAKTTQRGMKYFWEVADRWAMPHTPRTPFDLLRSMDLFVIQARLQLAGIGCYRQKGKGLWHLVQVFDNGSQLRSVKPEDLEVVQGIGPKTSRFFIMWTQPGVRLACLDTHVLKWLREHGVDAPKSTPTGRRYLLLEQEFLRRVPKDMTPAEFDLAIWKSYQVKPKEVS